MRHTVSARTSSGVSRLVVAAVTLSVAVVAAPALAKPAGKRIAVLPPSEGTAKDAVITAKLTKVLKQHRIHVVSGGPVKTALRKLGAPTTEGDWLGLARKLKVDGMIESTLSRSGTRRRVEMVVRNGADGTVVARNTFTAKGPPAKLAAAVAKGFWKELGAAISETKRPLKDEGPAIATRQLPPSEEAPAGGEPQKVAEESEPEGGEGEKEEATEASSEPGAADGKPAAVEARRAGAGSDHVKAPHEPPPIEVEVGGRVLRRAFKLTPASAGSGHAQNLMPTVFARAAWFPILYAGVFLYAEYNPLLKTNTTPAFPAGTRELVIGAQGRYPLSFGLLGFSAAYFQHLFVAGDTSDEDDALRTSLAWPNVAYQGARLAASGRFQLTAMFQVGVEAAYRLVTSPGTGETRVRSPYYFPNGKASYGLDGAAFVGAGVLPWLEIRLAADYRRYGFGALEPGAENTHGRADGASDDYLGFSLSAVGLFGGK